LSGEPDIPRAVWADAQAMLSGGWFGLKQKMAGSSKRPSYLALAQSGGLARALAAGREARGGTESQARRKQQSKHQSKHSNQQQPEQEGAAAEARAQKRSAAAEFERCLCAATQGTLDGIIRCYHGCVTITQLDCSAATEHIRYECSCWEFTAWLRCKRSLAASIASGVCAPVEFNTEAPVGRQRVGRPPNAERVWPAAGGSKGSSSSSKQQAEGGGQQGPEVGYIGEALEGPLITYIQPLTHRIYSMTPLLVARRVLGQFLLYGRCVAALGIAK